MAKAFGAAVRNLRRAPALSRARRPDAGARHWCDDRDVLGRGCGADQSTAIRESRSHRRGVDLLQRGRGADAKCDEPRWYLALRNEPGLFEAISASQPRHQHDHRRRRAGTGRRCESRPGRLSSVFPAAPLIGRLFTAEEAGHGTPIGISDGVGQLHGRDPGVIDRTLTIDDRPNRIVGVLPMRVQRA